MTISDWEADDSAWDRLQLGTFVMPGVWEITGGECARQVDHKKTKDKDGARIKDLGLLPPRFTARGRMLAKKKNQTTKSDWESLQEILPDINPRKKGGPKFPLSIFHPAVAVLGVNTIYVERIRPPEIRDGILEISIDMIEFAEPKATNISKKPATPSGYIGTDEDAKILAAQNRNWGLRRAGILAGSPAGGSFDDAGAPNQTNFDHASDEEFAKLTGEDTRHPPESTVVGSIDPSSR